MKLNQLASLRFLNLQYNHLDPIPNNFEFPRNLEVLHLGACSLTSLPQSLQLMPKLKILGLAGNPGLRQILTVFNFPLNIEKILLHLGTIHALPEKLMKLRKLRFLSIDKDILTSIELNPWEWEREYRWLEKFGLSEGKIESFPP
jgi:Leucine-rich repeat (LRR) protein